MVEESFHRNISHNNVGHLNTNLFHADYVKNNPRFFVKEISKILYQKESSYLVYNLECDGLHCKNIKTLKVVIESNHYGECFSRSYCYKCAVKNGFSSYLFKHPYGKEEE